ncbi:zinc finger Y-chromosomal 1-like protein [Labeo rohita]|uniref:Zinc finger Y-chromosomal 1-like protein n=1 Tax=Labeo rohita TaxID=84645 RepID=A0A498L4I1_LABRO|nr:zinc finger Y-chromosomal 1-like protein [Labeo rohita]
MFVIVMEERRRNYEDCARRIQAYWRSFRDRRLFRLLMNTVRSAEQCLASAVLRQLSPREAELLKDPSLKCKIRFRFAGPRFPPSVVFKIFRIGGGGHYLSGKKVFSPSNQATADTCRMMGNRAFMDLISMDEFHKAAVEQQDVICMKDYMQYSSHLDELPAYVGGRENGWRFLSLKVLSRDVMLREGVKPGTRGRLKMVLPFRHLVNSRFAGRQPSHRGSQASSRRSARAQNNVARKRRLYGLSEAERILDEQKHMDGINSHDMKKQNGTTEKRDIKIVLPSVETEDYDDSSSQSEWEEEAEKLCNCPSLASLSPGKCRSSAFRIFLRLCAVTCRVDGGSRCGGAAGCSASVCGAPPSLRTPRPAQRPLTPDPALPESGGIRRPACPGKIWRPPRALIYVDDAGKMVSGDGEEVTVEGAIDDQEVEKDEDGQEVIKVYIFKADSGEDDLGETVDLGENEAVALAEPVVRPLREKMVYMSVGDAHHTQTDGGSKLSDEVYMEVVVGGEEPVPHDRPYDSTALSKDFMPVAWAAAYGADEGCENRNGAASALLHIDESDALDKLNRQHGKNKRRAEPRQVQTGSGALTSHLLISKS